jgi:integrase
MPIKEKELHGRRIYEVTVSKRHGKKRYQRKRRVKTKRQAILLERSLLQELEDKISGAPNTTWDDFLEIFAEKAFARNITTEDQVTEIYGTLKKHFSPILGDTILRDMDEELLLKALDEVAKKKTKARHTKRQYVSKLRKVFHLAYRMKYISEDPTRFISIKSEPSKPRSLPSTADLQKFITAARKEAENAKKDDSPAARELRDWYYIWHFIMLTGARSGEAYALRWSDVDFDTRKITIQRSWSRKRGEEKVPKNNESRIVDIGDELDWLLRDIQNTYPAGPYILPKPRAWTQGEGARVLTFFLKGLGLPKMTMHDLRAVYITELLKQNVSVPDVMKLVSHKRLETTLRYVALSGVEVDGVTKNLSFLEKSEEQQDQEVLA